MKIEDLRNTLENNPVKDFDTMEAENQLEPIDNKIEDYEWHRHFCMGTKTYQLEDGLVKVRGVLNIVESMEWSDIDEYCEFVEEKEETAQDILDAFNKLQEKAIEIGHPIVLSGVSSTPLVLYIHDDNPDYVLVDKQVSSESKRCPHCNRILAPSDLPKSKGYKYTCISCDENFTEQEV